MVPPAAAPTAPIVAATAPPFLVPALRAAIRAFCFATGLARETTSQPMNALRRLKTLIASLLSRLCRSAPAGRNMDRTSKSNEACFLDRLRERGVCGHPVRHGLDRRLRVQRYHARFDEIGD